MRFKTVEVNPYTHTYCAFNKHTGETYGDFDCLHEATNFATGQPRRHERQATFSYTLKRESPDSHEVYKGRVFDDTGASWQRRYGRSIYVTVYHPAPDWVILDDLGDLVPENEVKRASAYRYRNHNWETRLERYALKGVRLTRIKGSGNKIKASCEQVPESWRGGGYDNRIRGYHRGPKTTRERRLNEAHVADYGWELVRGRRRCLPSNWDDRAVSIYKSEDNWKHHSKRRKQWKPK
jgi:hypothetical protein